MDNTNTKDYVGIAGFILAVISLGYTYLRGRLDNPRLIATACFKPNDTVIFYIIAQNHGRRKIFIESIQAIYDDGKTQTEMFSNLGGTPLDELEKIHIPHTDTYRLLNSGRASKLFIIDSTGRKHKVKHSKKLLNLYYPVAKQPRKNLFRRITER
jgi:hypothetical protein